VYILHAHFLEGMGKITKLLARIFLERAMLQDFFFLELSVITHFQFFKKIFN